MQVHGTSLMLCLIMRFHNEGKVTFNHKWYNLNTQDLMPTWRWWITDQNDAVDESSISSFVNTNLTFDEAYFGGSCLNVSGKSAFSRLKLFKTLLKVQPNYTLSITYKKTGDIEPHAKLFVALKGDLTHYKRSCIAFKHCFFIFLGDIHRYNGATWSACR